ncbi:MAG: polyprenyl diphosphate synthase [Anaerolineaceae bacterium]|nr:polyprenyl diphosphate synthase [Anaerolineaceae bacterium]
MTIATLTDLRQKRIGNEPEAVAKPRHVAIIMDGNGRWARARGLPRARGHHAGADNLRRVLRACSDRGIEFVTLFAFSTENWRRPRHEVRLIMDLLEIVIDRELEELVAEGVQIRHIGRLDGLVPYLQDKIRLAIHRTQHNQSLIVNLAFNYGGRDEITQAVRQIIHDRIPADAIDENLIRSYLFTQEQPDPDLIIRTSGELRVSNFLIWQGAYAEFYVTDTFWPDFDEAELQLALDSYARRKRRYGQTDEQCVTDSRNPSLRQNGNRHQVARANGQRDAQSTQNRRVRG